MSIRHATPHPTGISAGSGAVISATFPRQSQAASPPWAANAAQLHSLAATPSIRPPRRAALLLSTICLGSGRSLDQRCISMRHRRRRHSVPPACPLCPFTILSRLFSPPWIRKPCCDHSSSLRRLRGRSCFRGKAWPELSRRSRRRCLPRRSVTCPLLHR